MITFDEKTLIYKALKDVSRKRDGNLDPGHDVLQARRMEEEIQRQGMKMDKPLISVIVPIYNVAPYLRKCLDSLKNQTMREIEVIMIDDGSTDESGRIADEYVSDEWPVFRIIHTENRGLSAARNRGINEVRASWLMFVDSDDWVEPEFCEVPYKVAIEYGADIVIFCAYQVKKSKVRKEEITNMPRGIVDFCTAISYDGCAPWRRLYRNYLFDNIRYPEGRVFEDIAITHKVVHIAKRIYLLPVYLYFHVNRKNSITDTHSQTRHRDSLISNMERYEDLISWGYPAVKLQSQLCSSALGYLAYCESCEDNTLHSKAENIVYETKKLEKKYPIRKKLAFKVWKTDKKLFSLLSTIFRKIVHT